MQGKKFVAILSFITFLLLVSFSMAGKGEKTFTIEDVLKYESISYFEFSPDGTKILWLQRHPNKKKNTFVSHIWVSSLVNPEPIQLTRGDNSNYSPRWSPDGKKIAFISARDKKPQVYLLRVGGGEPEKLTNFEKGVNAFEWKDNEHLLILAREKEYKEEKDRKKKKDDAIVVEDIKYFYPVRLFLFSLKDKKVKRLTENRDRITSISVSPSGRYVITTHIQSPSYVAEPEHRPVYYLHDLETGESKEIFKDKYFSPSNFVWKDDDTVFFLEEKSNHEDKRGPGIQLLYRYSISKDKVEQIPLNWKNGVGGLYLGRLDVGGRWLAVALAKGAVNPILLIDISKPEMKKWKRYLLDDHLCTHFMGFKLSKDGKKIAFVYTTASTPPQLYWGIIRKGRIVKKGQITKLNEYLKNRFIAKTEVIRWKSEGGREIEGILYYPKDYQPGKRYPLIVNIHGGPAGYDADWFENSWAYYPHYYAAKGAFVLFVNYSGSSNYGLEFVESIFGRYYELELPDIVSGINYLIEKGMVDKNKLGVMGWSNGAILTIALTVEYPDMFKAASPGAGDVNWISDYGNCMFGPQFDELYFKGPPWKELEHYIQKSPLFKLERVKTPTLIMFGTEDKNVPTEQGWQHFRALKRIGKAPVRFILFPGEPHGLRKISHQRRKLEEETAWFDKYLFGIKPKEPPLYEKFSPLAARLTLKKAAKANGRYGVMINGILVPETVEIEGVKISRFEVTRAQFEYYLRENPNKAKPLGWNGKTFEPLTENYPVSRVSFEVAKDYCRWLSEKTGKKYRLPTEKELKKLIDKASGKENTLNYWAGYAPNPEEAEKLKNLIEKKLGSGSLILPVGSMGPSYKGLFDLNGNVAEWVVTKEGKGKVVGLAAIIPKDSKGKPKKICLCYTGFRVIEEK